MPERKLIPPVAVLTCFFLCSWAPASSMHGLSFPRASSMDEHGVEALLAYIFLVSNSCRLGEGSQCLEPAPVAHERGSLLDSRIPSLESGQQIPSEWGRSEFRGWK